MKKSIFLLLTFLYAETSVQVCAREAKVLDPFHSIVVSSEIITELVLSDREAIEVNFSGAEKTNLIVEVVDSVLKIRMKTGQYKDAKLNVRVHYTKDLRSMEANGRGQIWSEEELYFDNNLTVKLFNGGEMRFNLYCDSLSATLSQGSIIHLKGKARALQVKSTTNATFSGYEFETENAEVVATGTGKAKVSVSRYLKATASSKGFIGYVGEPPKVDDKTSLGGEILKTFLE